MAAATTLLAQFGERVRRLRHQRGLSQEALAHEAGLDRSYMGQVERGEKNISLLYVEKIARALGVPVVQLFRF